MTVMAVSPHPRTTICGVEFSCFDRLRAAQWLVDAALDGRGGYACVTGAHGIVLAQKDREFRNILNSANMNTLDGQPVVWIARWWGIDAGRVTGRELVWDVVRQRGADEIRHVLFGATAHVTDRMVDRLRANNSQIRVQAFNPPFGSLGDEELTDFCSRIRTNDPTIVWVGLSTPRQERVAAVLSKQLVAMPVVAIGAGFDFVAGLKPVAPNIVTVLGLEWLFRLTNEPKRLFIRYMQVVPQFLVLLGRELLGGSLFARQQKRPDAACE